MGFRAKVATGLVVAVTLLAPSASTAETIGVPLPQPSIIQDVPNCGSEQPGDITFLQMVDPASGYSYAAPGPGTITAIRAQLGRIYECAGGSATLVGSMTGWVRALRPTPTPFRYQLVGQSEAHPINADSLNEVSGLYVRVQQGDLIAFGRGEDPIYPEIFAQGLPEDRVYQSMDSPTIGSELGFQLNGEPGDPPKRMLMNAEFTPDPPGTEAYPPPDITPPSIKLTKPRNGRSYRPFRKFKMEIGADATKVEIALRRRSTARARTSKKAGSARCRWMKKNSKKARKQFTRNRLSCSSSKALWHQVKKIKNGNAYFTLRRALRPGVYQVYARAYDAAGNYTRAFNVKDKNKAKFRIKTAGSRNG